MKNGQKLKLGDSHFTPRHFQEEQASKLGDAQGIPFFINKNIRSCFSTLYFYCFICYVLFLEHLYFCFQFKFSLVCCSSWLDPSSLVLERFTLCFHCLEHSSFILITLRVFSCCQRCLQYSFLFRTVYFFSCSQVCSTLWSLLSISLVSCSKKG